MRLPNFFLAGAPRAGTTSFYSYLGQHPEIYVSPIKEPAFFAAEDLLSGRYGSEVLKYATTDRAALRPYLEGTPPTGPEPLVLERENYLELFRSVRNETAVGEGTVSYFWLPSAARAIQKEVPQARLLFILRDSAERLFSHHLAALWFDPHRTFRERFLAAANSPSAAPSGLVEDGKFATNLQRFFECFPRDHIRVYLYEDYRSAPHSVLRDAFGFLGVDPGHPVDLSLRHHETQAPRFPRVHALRRRIFGPPGAGPRLPEIVRRLLRPLYQRPHRDITMDPADRRLVIDYYREEIVRTADLIGRDLSAWLR